jgi:hypothetical protein
MHLDSYVCENCILQKVESVYHLFLRCNFAKNGWRSIGVTAPGINCPQRAATSIIRQLHVQGALEIMILMTWSIWKCHNGWIFENNPPSIERCGALLSQELKWLHLRASQRSYLHGWKANNSSLCFSVFVSFLLFHFLSFFV